MLDGDNSKPKKAGAGGRRPFAALLLAGSGCFFYYQSAAANANKAQQDDFIKWVDFNVTYQALDYSIKLDMEYRDSQTPVSFISLLAYLAAKNGNNFKRFKTSQLDAVIEQIKSGKTIEELAAGLKYYDYYLEAYTAALSGLVGWYEIEVKDQSSQSGKRWERRYGIKAFSPIAKGFTTTTTTISGPAGRTASSAGTSATT